MRYHSQMHHFVGGKLCDVLILLLLASIEHILYHSICLEYEYVLLLIINAMNGQQPRRIIKSASVRTRFTPTFYHHDIFNAQPHQSPTARTRVTPTFHSSLFDSERQFIQTYSSSIQRSKQAPKQQPQQHVYYVNQSRQRKQAFLNPCMHYIQHQNQPCLDDKERITYDINHLEGRTSRLRKCVEQMSNPIFGEFTWNLLTDKQQSHPYNPNDYRYKDTQQQPNRQKSVQKEEADITDHNSRPTATQLQKQTSLAVSNKKQSKPPNIIAKTVNKASKHDKNLTRFKSASTLPRRDKK